MAGRGLMVSPTVGCLRFLCILAAMFLLVSCAPKKVRVYEPLPESRVQLVNYAVGYVGKPYKNGAKGPDAFDCSGFIHHVFKRFDVNLPYTTEELDRVGYPIPRDGAVAGDLVVFRIKRSYHIGIMVNGSDFVHASLSRGVAIDNVEQPYWKRSIVRFRRVM